MSELLFGELNKGDRFVSGSVMFVKTSELTARAVLSSGVIFRFERTESVSTPKEHTDTCTSNDCDVCHAINIGLC